MTICQARPMGCGPSSSTKVVIAASTASLRTKGVDSANQKKATIDQNSCSYTANQDKSDLHVVSQSADTANQEKGHIGQSADTANQEKGHIGQSADTANQEKGHIGQSADTANQEKGHIGQSADTANQEKGHIGQSADTANQEKGHISQSADRTNQEKGHLSQSSNPAIQNKGLIPLGPIPVEASNMFQQEIPVDSQPAPAVQTDAKDSKETDNEKTAADKRAPPTEEEIQQTVNDIFEQARKTWEPLNDNSVLMDAETGICTAKYRNIALNSFNYHFKMKSYSMSVQSKFKSDYYLVMIAANAVTKFCDMVMHILKQGYTLEDGSGMDMNMYRPLVNTFGLLTNFTDNTIDRADIVANHPGFLELIAGHLKAATEHHLSGEESAQLQKVSCGSPMSICHNIAMRDNNIARMRSLGFVDIMKPYMNSPLEKTRLTAVATLADIVDEEQSEIIRADLGIMKFLKRCLERAMKEKTRRILGWATQELARTVKRIASNDANKRALVEQGILPPLVTLAESEDVEEQREAVGAMWTLSFDEQNQDVMIGDNECQPVDTFIRLQNSPDKEVRKSCNGALWTMREKLAKSEKYKHIGEKFTAPRTSPPQSAVAQRSMGGLQAERHIMVSYQWGHQQMLKMIRDGLRANGFRVWMDIDDMEGSTLDAMARAVEDADVVLICFSQKYKDSDNCRAEAEYAFQKKKKVIPLKMELNYKPDGWLGFICGAKLFFDFGGKYSFESRMEGLVKELRAKMNKDVVDAIIVPEKSVALSGAPPLHLHDHIDTPRAVGVSPVAMTTVESVKKWKEEDVGKWMVKHSLSMQQVKKLTGIEIAFLLILKVESPDFFYKTITETLKMTSLLTIAQFRFALDDTNI